MRLGSFDGHVYLDLGVYAVAGDEPFEIWSRRAGYAKPIEAVRVTGGTPVPLSGLKLRDFRGLPGFFHVVVKDTRGRVVVERRQRFCPNGDAERVRPDAPTRSPYPGGADDFGSACPTNPFTLGSVWGLQQGWAKPLFSWEQRPVALEPGAYTATARIAPRYVSMFGIPEAAATRTVRVRVVRCGECRSAAPSGDDQRDRARGGAPGAAAGRSRGIGVEPHASAPTGPEAAPAGPLPDLRSLPAFEVEMVNRRRTGRSHLAFAANVWNAGDSPLVVDGFRRRSEKVMDAYQYFFDADGNETGYAETGSMEWDSRDGHRHWHFLDFARYRLLDADKTSVARSRKEAFCLANTDAVDYTVPGANWQPFNTDLHTSCGEANSLSIREVLDQGSGDTYFQYLPGQSFDVTNLRNGTYYIEVTANPMSRLHESDTSDNTSYRRVLLGGRLGARTVRVPPVGLVDDTRD